MNAFKKALILSPVLALPDNWGNITLDTDACNIEIDCVLSQQKLDKTAKPVRYWSELLTDGERKNDMTRRECLAIVWSVWLVRPYLKGMRFNIWTDHNSLKWLSILTKSNGRRTSRRLRLSENWFRLYSPRRRKLSSHRGTLSSTYDWKRPHCAER